jgi:hypothetical protein
MQSESEDEIELAHLTMAARMKQQARLAAETKEKEVAEARAVAKVK